MIFLGGIIYVTEYKGCLINGLTKLPALI